MVKFIVNKRISNSAGSSLIKSITNTSPVTDIVKQKQQRYVVQMAYFC